MGETTTEQALSGFVSVKEAAQRKGVSLSTIYKAMRAGKLAGVPVLGRTALRLADVEVWTPSAHGGSRRRKGVPEPARRLQRLIAEQGVHPVTDPAELRGDFWPDDGPDIDSILRQWREEPEGDAV